MNKKEKINRLLSRDDLSEQEREYIKSLKQFMKEYKHLTYNQTRGLYNLYFKYFINTKKAKKENKSLDSFKWKRQNKTN